MTAQALRALTDCGDAPAEDFIVEVEGQKVDLRTLT